MKRPREEVRHRVLDVPVLPVQKRLVRALANRRQCQMLGGSKPQNRSGGESFRFPPPYPGKARGGGGGGVLDKPSTTTTPDITAAATSEIRDTAEGCGKRSIDEVVVKPNVKLSSGAHENSEYSAVDYARARAAVSHLKQTLCSRVNVDLEVKNLTSRRNELLVMEEKLIWLSSNLESALGVENAE